jgi:stage II sporulation protein AA (anti-sigma F factor antagonist)
VFALACRRERHTRRRWEIDLFTRGQFEKAILAAADLPAREVIVDFSGVSFIDASGIQALVAAQDEIANRNMELRLRNVSPTAWRILQIAGVIDLVAPAD